MMTVKELREKLLGDVDYTDIKNILDEFEQGIRNRKEYLYSKGYKPEAYQLRKVLGGD